MYLISSFEDGGAVYRLRNGELAEIKQDPNGMWGFETDAGYTEWEAESLLSTDRRAVDVRLMAYEKLAWKQHQEDIRQNNVQPNTY